MHSEKKPDIRFYKVTGMSCAACSSRVEKTVAALQGVDSCFVNLLTGDLRVEGAADETAVIRSVEEIGYGCMVKNGHQTEKSVSDGTQTGSGNEEDLIKKQLIFSVILLIPLFVISMKAGSFAGNQAADSDCRPLFTACAEFLLSSLILLINRRYFISGFKALSHRSAGMDTLIALGSGISWAWSVFVFFKMCSLVTLSLTMEDAWRKSAELLGQLYFESAAMIPTVITVGKFLEAGSKGKTADAVNSLKKLRPQKAHIVTEEGETEIDSEYLRPGDRFTLRPGESVPADGVILNGESLLDESMLSGESRPVEKSAISSVHSVQNSNRVFAATINKTGFLLCECQKSGNETVFSQIIRMVTEASATKAPAARLADKAAAYFVPAVLMLSAATLLIWLISGELLHIALQRSIAVLVISCPCALGLATPVAIMVASGVGARNGILFKTAEALELTGKMKTAVFDKTGTITTGKPEVSSLITAEGNENEFLKEACSLEAASEHPLANAVVEYAESFGIKPDPVSGFKATGSSISAVYKGDLLTAGSRRSAVNAGVIEKEIYGFEKEIERNTSLGRTPVFFVRNGKLSGFIFCEDTIRDEAADAVNTLESMGIQTVLLSGDDETVARSVGRKTGIKEVIAGVLPSEKARRIEKFRVHGEVLMVGDGINDAPALTAADIGIAVASGTDVALDAADVVLMKSNLRDIPAAVMLSRETLKTIRQNLFWAVFYNALCIPAAAGLLIKPFGISVSPMLGAAAMSISSLFVVTNALRLNHLNLYPEKKCKEVVTKMEMVLNIKGMMCPHCEARVKKALCDLPGVETAEVSYQKGTACVFGTAAVEELKKAVTDAGYEVSE